MNREEWYCPRGQVLDEMLTLTAANFTFSRDELIWQQGTHIGATAAACGTIAPVPVIALTGAANHSLVDVPVTLDK